MEDIATILNRLRAVAGFGEGKICQGSPVTQEKPIDPQAAVLAELNKERQDSFRCWVLEEWRRVSIPDWRRILQESIEKRDRHREEYARWMLREVLLDSEYQEPEA